MKILVVYYSMYGHIYQMMQAAVEGAKSVKGAKVTLKRVPETLPKEVLAQMGAAEAQKAQAEVEVCTVEDLGRRQRRNLRHSHALRQYVRADAAVP